MLTRPDSQLTADVVLVEVPDDNREFLEAAAEGVRVRRLAEVAELETAADWVARHGHPMLVEPGRRDPMITPGGDGTPAVREYALPELAMARGEHTLRTRSMVADVLDLQHRLPLTWAKVRAGDCDPWVARRKQAGIARLEAQGPLLIQALSELLGHADVQLKPVLDHRIRTRVDAYEHPDPLKDHAWTSTGGDVFPYSPRTATRAGVDFDHAQPFIPPEQGGPPGQTGPHNCGPLRRAHHRWKTHGGYRVRQAGPGRHLWQTPHGLCYLVDPTGTHPLNNHDADLILTAPPGLDIYPSRTSWELVGS